VRRTVGRLTLWRPKKRRGGTSSGPLAALCRLFGRPARRLSLAASALLNDSASGLVSRAERRIYVPGVSRISRATRSDSLLWSMPRQAFSAVAEITAVRSDALLPATSRCTVCSDASAWQVVTRSRSERSSPQTTRFAAATKSSPNWRQKRFFSRMGPAVRIPSAPATRCCEPLGALLSTRSAPLAGARRKRSLRNPKR